MNSKRIFTWIGFIIVIALIIWGLIAANEKSANQANLLPLPNEITSADHVSGDADAPVTLVEYGDFQCPACGAYYPLVEAVLSDEGSSTVRFVFRHFPLSQHPNAVPAALASEAASDQGKFWEMYNILYQNQDDWVNLTDPSPIFDGYATKLGLDLAQFKTDEAASSTVAIVNNDYAGGVNANIQGTPTFFLNGKQIANPQSKMDFEKLINDAASSTPAS